MSNICVYILKETISVLFVCLGGVFWLKLLYRNKSALVILNYHNFSKYNNYKFKRGDILQTGYVKNFEKQLRLLKKHFTFCYPEEFFEGKLDKGLKILITFDDGYKDNYELALPLMKKHQAKAIFFVSSKYIMNGDFLVHDKIRYLIQNQKLSQAFGSIATNIYQGIQNYSKMDLKHIEERFKAYKPAKRLIMNSNELALLSKQGMTVGNHTYDHVGLSFLDRSAQRETIKRCNSDIANITKVKIEHIAYPNGLYNNCTLSLLENLGFTYGYTINAGVNSIMDSKYELKRIGINVSDSKYLLVLKLFVNGFKK